MHTTHSHDFCLLVGNLLISLIFPTTLGICWVLILAFFFFIIIIGGHIKSILCAHCHSDDIRDLI